MEDLFFFATRFFYVKPFFKALKMNETVFGTLVWKFIYHYNHKGNAFHNFLHGVCVLHSANYFLMSVDSLNSLVYGTNVRSPEFDHKK